MAQMLVRKLEERVKQRLRRRAVRNGRSLEEEARDILRAAAAAEPDIPQGLGSAISARFAGRGLEAPIAELRGQLPRAANFEA